MIGRLGRKYLNRCCEGAVDKGKTVTGHYTMSGWQHVDSVRIEQFVEQLISELVLLSSAPGAGPASALGLIASEEHGDGRINVTFTLSSDGRDVGCRA